jgi:hypothetical protein
MKDTELAYLAGIIDGEGHIGLLRHSKSRPRGGRYVGFVPRVMIGFVETPASKALLESVKAEFGGILYPKKPSHFLGRKSFNPQIAFELRNNSAIVFLRAVRPYLKLKHKQADTMLTFTRMNTGRYPLPQVEREKREAIYLTIKGLNGNKSLTTQRHLLTP